MQNTQKLDDFLKAFPKMLGNTPPIEGELVDCVKNGEQFYLSIRSLDNELPAVIFNDKPAMAKIGELQKGEKISIWGRPVIYQQRLQIQVWDFATQHEKGEVLSQKIANFERLKPHLKRQNINENNTLSELSEPLQSGDVAIVTSENSKALSDVTRALSNYLWKAENDDNAFFPANVQGKGALESIVAALKKADDGGFKFIILCRGGGSAFELDIFNAPEIAQTILQMKTPVITAIGHTDDFSLADLASTYAAETPTAAGKKLAELNRNFFATHKKQSAQTQIESDKQSAQEKVADARKQGMKIGAIITAILFIILWAVF